MNWEARKEKLCSGDQSVVWPATKITPIENTRRKKQPVGDGLSEDREVKSSDEGPLTTIAKKPDEGIEHMLCRNREVKYSDRSSTHSSSMKSVARPTELSEKYKQTVLPSTESLNPVLYEHMELATVSLDENRKSNDEWMQGDDRSKLTKGIVGSGARKVSGEDQWGVSPISENKEVAQNCADKIKKSDDGSIIIPKSVETTTVSHTTETLIPVLTGTKRFVEVKKSDDRRKFTPTLKLETRKAKLSKPLFFDDLVVLLTTGSMNPIHKGHVKNMEIAKDLLEKEARKKVLCGYISPSHDSWLSRKKYGFLRVEHRIKMAKLACRNSDWIHCDAHEGSVGRVMDFPEVIKKLSTFLDGLPVYYVCGADHAEKCYLWRQSKYVVIGRENTRVPSYMKCLYYKNEDKNISSTEIRKAMTLKKLETVRHLLHPEVFDYLKREKPKLHI